MMKLIEKHHFKTVILLLVLLQGAGVFGQQAGHSLPPNSDQVIPALNFKETDIRDILRSIAYEYKTNIMIENTINIKTSTALFNVSVFNAVRLIAEDNGFVFSYDSMRYFVKSKSIEKPSVPIEHQAEVTYERGKISVNLNDVDINNLVSKLREVTNKNYLITAGASGRITGTLKNIDLNSGLKNLLLNNGFYLTIKDSIYYFSKSAYFSSLDSKDQQVRGSYWVHAHDGLVTMDVHQALVEHVVDDIANQLNLQILKLSNIEGTTTLKCSEVPLETAFNYIFQGTKSAFRNDQGAYIIGDKTSQNLSDTKLIKLLYLRADKFKESIPTTISKDAIIGVSIEHNGLIVTGSTDAIERIKEYVSAVDKPVPQVMIEALVIDYNLTNDSEFGIKIGKGDSTYTSGSSNSYYPGVDVTASGARINKLLSDIGSVNLFGKNFDLGKAAKLPSDFYVNLKALENKGLANVKSRPILSTLNGHTASLKIGTVQNYVFTDVVPITSAVSTTYIQKEEIQKVEANISFEITPWVGPNNELTLEIKPDFQTPVGTFSPDKNLIPAINTRSMVSTVRLRDGETIVLGGLIQDSDTDSKDQFPILGEIPFIGSLFTNTVKKKTKGELMIYLTPRISYGDDMGNLYLDYSK
jgi:type IV pilus assembly protein PilQ